MSNADTLHTLEVLNQLISRAKQELSSMPNSLAKENKLTEAKDELDAIIDATSQATATIMDAADQLESLADKVPSEIRNTIKEQTMNIYQACSFQDLTGQRISKIIKILKYLEGFLSGVTSKDPEENALLNGPQKNAPDQREIDAFFNSL